MGENLMMSVTVDEYNSLSGSEVDASILLPIVNDFFTRCVELGETHRIVDAVDASVSDTGIDFHQTLNALERNGLEAYMMDYSVHYDAEITEVTEV